MIRNLKALGLSLVAVLALGAMMASAAQAAPFFHSESAPAIQKGTEVEKNKFTTASGTVECASTFRGTTTSTTTTTVTMKPTYSNCTAFGFVGATIDVNECGYMFHLVENSSPATATVDLECTNAGEEMRITAGFCTVHVKQQSGLAHVTFANGGSKTSRDITATLNVGGIHYVSTSGCFNSGTHTDGVYEGSVTIKGYTDPAEVQQGIWVE
jgi:hypothetical protein